MSTALNLDYDYDEACDNQEPVTATLISCDELRLEFLPTFFGVRYMMAGERHAYAAMGRLSSEYNGGHWNFYTLSNGGFYMAPRIKEIKLDEFGTVSGNAAGVAATMFAINRLLCDGVQGVALEKELSENYYRLRDFISELPESDRNRVYRAID